MKRKRRRRWREGEIGERRGGGETGERRGKNYEARGKRVRSGGGG